ncbi:MAG: hypothetical protein Kow0099_15620 [Candidatus Abyssubacteria bacterium]
MVEKGIRPLVDAINRLGFASTVYSCQGHFDEMPSEKYLPTAYVTFGVTELPRFAAVYQSLLALETPLLPARLTLTYDCFLGRYTLSLWPGGSACDPQSKRMAVDRAITLVVDAVNAGTSRPPEDLPSGTKNGPALPCNEHVPPCMLVIPPTTLNCPFEGLTI